MSENEEISPMQGGSAQTQKDESSPPEDVSIKIPERRGRLSGYLKPLVGIAIFLAVVAVIAVLCWDYISALGTDAGRARMEKLISSLGFWGWLVTLGIQVVQIVIAILPGEPVELLLGFMWGPIWGTLTCLLGILIGTVLVYFLAKWLGRPFVKLIVGEEDERRYKFLNDPRKLDITVFILFFIPGTPKDVLTFLVPMTPMKPLKYFIIATVARIPSVVTSTVLGDSILSGDYALAIAVFALTAVISVTGIILGNLYMKKKQSEKDDK